MIDYNCYMKICHLKVRTLGDLVYLILSLSDVDPLGDTGSFATTIDGNSVNTDE